MAASRGVLTPADARQLAHAAQLLQQRDPASALKIVQEIATRAPASADAFHLLALCEKNLGRRDAAAAAFETATRLAPRDPNILSNHANFIYSSGRAAAAVELYRRALTLAPAHADAWLNLGLALLDIPDIQASQAALQKAAALAPQRSTIWQALGSAYRAAGDLENAADAQRRAVAVDPGNGAAWTNLGVVMRLLGNPEESLQCYARARAAGFDAPELDDAEASAHLDLGNPRAACELTRHLVSRAPHYVPGHTMLAQLLWEHGADLADGEDPRRTFRSAVAQQPGNHVLRSELVRFLLDSGAAGDALAEIRDGQALQGRRALITSEARALEMLGDMRAADALFEQFSASMQADAAFQNLYVRHLLRSGRPGDAGRVALGVVEREPHNQAALAYLSVAWRLLDDPREHWLCAYDRLVSPHTLRVPEGYSSEHDFVEALQTVLDNLHVASREPVNQSVRGGSQTSGNLFGRPQRELRELRDAVTQAVAEYVAGLPTDPTHPFLNRRRNRIRFAGSWSVRLKSSGNHANHFHQKGWISSAFYVALPPSVQRSSGTDPAGWLQFGEPPPDLGQKLVPRRMIKPRVGQLVLFPSYLWHGTVPFEDDEPRLTVAFDVAPARDA